MKTSTSIITLLAFFSVNLVVQAQQKDEKVIALEEVVISATKFELKKEHATKIIYQITSKEIQQNAGKSVIDVLNNLPGIEIKGVNSNPGEIRGTFIRGGRSRQVLVLIDGVPVSDPTGINQEYDLRMLSLNQIESIEVLKGSSSALYGSGAATGVINIILKKASKKVITAQYEVSLGTNSSAESSSQSLLDRNQNIRIDGALNSLDYLAYFSVTGVNGMSSAKSNNSNQLFSNDPFYGKNGLLKLGYQINQTIKVNTFFNYDSFDYSYDAGAYTDSDLNKGTQEQLRFGIKSNYIYNAGEVYLLASINDLKRILHSFNSFSNAINTFDFNGRSINLDLVNKISFSDEKFQLITGINYQEHSNNTISDFGNIDKELANFKTIDPYMSLLYFSNFGLNAAFGTRYNIHSNYGNYLVYDASISYEFYENDDSKIKVMTSYGTSFIAPSIYQLFSQYGFLDLQPEINKTIEIGVEINYKKAVSTQIVYFDRNEESAIIFKNLFTAPFGVYTNSIGNINVKGIESNFTIQVINKLSLQFGYTYVDKDVDKDYIPTHKLVANLEFQPINNILVSINYKKIGERTYFDEWGSFGTVGDNVVLPNYNIVDVNANYTVNDTILLFGSFANIFDVDYEETLGYSTRGRNFKIGVRLHF